MSVPPIPLAQFAEQYFLAPVDYSPWTAITIGASTRVDITPNMPAQGDLGRAPFFALIVSLSTALHNQGLIGVSVTDDVAVNDPIFFPSDLEVFDGIVVPRLRPLSDDGVNLDALLAWITTQRVYLCNETLAEITIHYGAAWPSMDWI